MAKHLEWNDNQSKLVWSKDHSGLFGRVWLCVHLKRQSTRAWVTLHSLHFVPSWFVRNFSLLLPSCYNRGYKPSKNLAGFVYWIHVFHLSCFFNALFPKQAHSTSSSSSFCWVPEKHRHLRRYRGLTTHLQIRHHQRKWFNLVVMSHFHDILKLARVCEHNFRETLAPFCSELITASDHPWPKISSNVLSYCQKNGCLVFQPNVFWTQEYCHKWCQCAQ